MKSHWLLESCYDIKTIEILLVVERGIHIKSWLLEMWELIAATKVFGTYFWVLNFPIFVYIFWVLYAHWLHVSCMMTLYGFKWLTSPIHVSYDFCIRAFFSSSLLMSFPFIWDNFEGNNIAQTDNLSGEWIRFSKISISMCTLRSLS